MVLWISFLLILSFTGLSQQYGRTGSATDLTCLPRPSDAPYGLTSSHYDILFYSTQEALESLIAQGCSVKDLSKLISCEIKTEKELRSSIKATSKTCQAQLQSTIGHSWAYLQRYGCLNEDMHQSVDLTPSETLQKIYVTAQNISPQTTCSAYFKTVRNVVVTLLHNPVNGSNREIDGFGKHNENTDTEGNGSKLWIALLAGALAGLAVDLSLYPLDTIKTRLQSASGFRAAGAFSNLYQGVGSIALGSAPSSALFFLAYEFANDHLAQNIGQSFRGHLLATTIGEVASSLLRVPADVVKSRLQIERTSLTDESTGLWKAVKKIYKEDSGRHMISRCGSFYAGWLSSLLREIPFGCIQFPLFEHLKEKALGPGQSIEELSLLTVALCGMIAGSCAGSLTTPLDVIKTRIMLAERGESGIFHVLRVIYREDGIGGFFKGVVPRTMWISLGGAIFLGGYNAFVAALSR